MNRYRLLLLILLLIVFDPALAAVMDNEPSLTQNIIWGVVGSVLCLVAARYKPWLLLVVGPLPILYFVNLIGVLQHPFVGPAILREAGKLYIYSGYGLGISVLVSIVVGTWWSAVKTRQLKDKVKR